MFRKKWGNNEYPDMGPEGIGGWLILPAIGLLIAPFTAYLSCYELLQILSEGDFEGAEIIYPGITLYVIIDLTVFLLLLIYQLVTLTAFFLKKPYTPTLMIINYLVGLFISISTNIWGTALMNSDPNLALISIMPNFIGTLIWVPYFLFSKRVKNTFV